MKIKVVDLEPNPFRKMKTYPIDRAKVEALKTSIKEKTFWDNILVRRHKGKYQLAYGHHRWIALKELGITEIDIPIRDIDDATMVRIMAEENLNWSTSPAVLIQTIQTAKEFLDAELAKADSLECLGDFARALFKGIKGDFFHCKKNGVGRDTLIEFLGGNWTGHYVKIALNILKDANIDKEAIQTIPSMRQAAVFQKEVIKHKIPKPTQKKIAKVIAKEGLGYRQIPDLVEEHSLSPAKKKKIKSKSKPVLDDFVKETSGLINALYTNLGHIKGHLDNIHSKILRESFVRDGRELLELMKEIFKNETEKKKKTRKVLSSSS